MDDRPIEDTSGDTTIDERADPATSEANGQPDRMTDEGAPAPSEPAPGDQP